MEEKIEQKETTGEKKPVKSFRTFMVRDMREEQYTRFRNFCDKQGMDFAETIILLMSHWDFSWSLEELHKRIDEMEQKEEKVKRKTFGGGKKDE